MAGLRHHIPDRTRTVWPWDPRPSRIRHTPPKAGGGAAWPLPAATVAVLVGGAAGLVPSAVLYVLVESAVSGRRRYVASAGARHGVPCTAPDPPRAFADGRELTPVSARLVERDCLPAAHPGR